MTTTQWIAVASIAAVVVSAAAIAAGLMSVRDQLRITIFLEYTKRYGKIMKGMPYEARDPDSGYKLASQEKDERHRVLAIFREYLNLCSEEKWLHDHHRIDHPTWGIWKYGMEDVARFPCFGDAWVILYPEYEAYGGFQDFVAKLLPSESSRDASVGSASRSASSGVR